MAGSEADCSSINTTSGTGSVITVHPDSDRPTRAWQKLKVKQIVKRVTPTDPHSEVPPNHIRFVCLSDTHSRIENLPNFVPFGNVLLHAGDITNVGLPGEVEKFNNFLGKLPHEYKIVIAGNHDLTFDDDMVKNKRDDLQNRFGVSQKKFEDVLKERDISSVKEMLTNCIYLEDSAVEVFGLKVYGSPWQPEFCDWGFNLPRGTACLEKWNMIPDDTDILMTHGPPLGHGDMCFSELRAGCLELLSTVQQRVKPKVHVFGHIHEDYGVTTDGCTKYINASNSTIRYKVENKPIVFDLPLPNEFGRDSKL